MLEKVLTSPYVWGFLTYIIGQIITHFKAKDTAKKTESKIAGIISETDKKQNERFDILENKVSEFSDMKKHESFAKMLNSKLTTESYNFISDFKELDNRVRDFLLQGANNAISIFDKILYSGFENYSKQVVISQFHIASVNISSKFSGYDFPIEKELLFSVIEKQRRKFVHDFDTLINNKEIVNGVRRKAFEKLCLDMIIDIISEVSSLKGANR